jgi:hypothetical protein
MKVQWLGLRNAVGKIAIGVAPGPFRHNHFFHRSIYLVRGGEDEDRFTTARPCSLQHVERTEGIDFKVGSRIVNRGGHRHLSGQMINYVSIFGGCPAIFRVPYIAMDEMQQTT